MFFRSIQVTEIDRTAIFYLIDILFFLFGNFQFQSNYRPLWITLSTISFSDGIGGASLLLMAATEVVVAILAAVVVVVLCEKHLSSVIAM